MNAMRRMASPVIARPRVASHQRHTLARRASEGESPTTAAAPTFPRWRVGLVCEGGFRQAGSLPRERVLPVEPLNEVAAVELRGVVLPAPATEQAVGDALVGYLADDGVGPLEPSNLVQHRRGL